MLRSVPLACFLSLGFSASSLNEGPKLLKKLVRRWAGAPVPAHNVVDDPIDENLLSFEVVFAQAVAREDPVPLRGTLQCACSAGKSVMTGSGVTITSSGITISGTGVTITGYGLTNSGTGVTITSSGTTISGSH